jgi:acyl-CoA thioester hydrolase
MQFMEPTQRPSELADFPIQIAIPVQWGDQDGFGHVNGVMYLKWFESARVAYLESSLLGNLMVEHNHIGPIMASITCNYRRQIRYPDVVVIGAKVTRIGRTSIEMHHAIYSTTDKAIGADGTSILVYFNYKKQTPVPVTEDLRLAFEKMEGKQLA